MTTPDTVKIHADRTVTKQLGNWTTARDFDVHSHSGMVELDLRSPQIPDGDIEVHIDLDKALLKLLVADDAVIEASDVEWDRKPHVKDWQGPTTPGGRRVHLAGAVHKGEIRVHRSGIAVLSAMFSQAFVEDALKAHQEGTPLTVLDPANPVSEPTREPPA